MICIDDYGGKDGKLTESVILDMKNKKIINLYHADKNKVTEDFDARRKRIERRRKNAEEDLAAQPPGPQRDKLEKLYRALLDNKRRFALAPDPGPPKTLLGLECKPVKVIAAEEEGYVPLLRLSAPRIGTAPENAEVLFLLQIIGEKMTAFLHKHEDIFKHVPMELHLDLAAGGKLDTRTVSVTKVADKDLDLAARGGPWATRSPFLKATRNGSGGPPPGRSRKRKGRTDPEEFTTENGKEEARIGDWGLGIGDCGFLSSVCCSLCPSSSILSMRPSVSICGCLGLS